MNEDLQAEATTATPRANAFGAPPEKQDRPEKPVELSAILCLSHKCTLSCDYCYRPRRPPQASMAKDTLDRALDFIVDQLCRGGARCGLFLNLTGEPLLALGSLKAAREQIIARLASTDGRVYLGRSLVTNCTAGIDEVLSDPYWDNHLFYVSIDGTKQTHDAARRYPDGAGSYDTAFAGAKALLETGRVIGVSSVLTGLHPDLVGMFAHLKKEGFTGISIKPVRVPPDNRCAVNESNIESVKEAYTQFADYIASHSGHELLDVLLRLSKADFFCRFLIRSLLNVSLAYRCAAAKTNLAIDCDGRILPCQAFASLDGFEIGDIFSGLSPRWRAIYVEAGNVDVNPVCKRCDIRHTCGGCCPYQAALVNGSVIQPDGTRCKLVRHIVMLARGVAGVLREREPAVLRALALPELDEATSGRSQVACGELSDGSAGGWRDRMIRRPPDIQLDDACQVRRKVWRARSDLSAKIWLAWDRTFLYLAARVEDDVFHQPFCAELFHMGDHVKLVISDSDKADVSVLGFARIGNSPVLLQVVGGLSPRVVPAAEAAVERAAGATMYHCRVAWDEIGLSPPSPHEERLFGVAVYDNDAQAVSGWIEWTAGVLPTVKMSLLGCLHFLPEGTPLPTAGSR